MLFQVLIYSGGKAYHCCGHPPWPAGFLRRLVGTFRQGFEVDRREVFTALALAVHQLLPSSAPS